MFRIILFTINKHTLLRNKKFELSNPEERSTDNYFTIVIGPNGTGKSFLMKELIESFNEISLLKSNETYKSKKRFDLIYLLDDISYSISIFDKNTIYIKNGQLVSVNEIQLPYKWIASSVTINDKFPILNYIRKKQINSYHYLGIRSATNNAFIGRITTNTVLSFLTSLRKGYSSELLTLFNSLSLNPLVQIVFNGGPMLKLDKVNGKYIMPKNSSQIIEPHISFLNRNQTTTNYRADNYKKYISRQPDLDIVFDFIKMNQTKFEKSSKGTIIFNYSIDLENGNGINMLLEDWNAISIMLDLEIIKINKFLITKAVSFSYEEASSGESHLLSSLLGIIATIDNNSMIIVDEPEVSLHPNWQIEYFDILKIIVSRYKGLHVFIATHSNLLVSSLKNEESRIISLKREKESGEILIKNLDYETFGWDPERILYKIFGLVTLRNNYFESDLRQLISLISKEQSDLNEVQRLYDILKKYILSDIDDPLTIIISRAKNYIENYNG